MAAIRDIVTHVTIEVALKKRICHRNRKKHAVQQGQKCLAVYGDGGDRKNYCPPCALEILIKARQRILLMESEMSV